MSRPLPHERLQELLISILIEKLSESPNDHKGIYL